MIVVDRTDELRDAVCEAYENGEPIYGSLNTLAAFCRDTERELAQVRETLIEETRLKWSARKGREEAELQVERLGYLIGYHGLGTRVPITAAGTPETPVWDEEEFARNQEAVRLATDKSASEEKS